MDSRKIEYYPPINREVKTEYGTLRGIAGANPIYTVFKGVPYAKPPVGALRWEAPQEPESWEGVRVADSFSAIAPQEKHPVDSLYGKEFFQSPEPMSEDCLYLNIWTPTKTRSEKMPVLFWIHGGGFSGGYGYEPEFDGEAFCRRGIIVITISYRLGVFGFLAHHELSEKSASGTSGNYGHMDQIAALKWVRRNISAFGGDPSNITIAGQSAGGGSVMALMTSELSKGEIARAIVQSSLSHDKLNFVVPGSIEAAYATSEQLMRDAGCANINELRALSYEKLREAGVGTVPGKFSFRPIVDGYVLKSTTWKNVEDGKHPEIPYMVGCTAGEGGIFSAGTTVERFEESARNLYGKHADGYIRICDVKTPEEAVKTIKSLHAGLVCCRSFCEKHDELGRSPAYMYIFDRDLPGSDAGSFHSSELWYVFGTINRCWRPMTGVDHDISNLMTDYWANFARTGDPNGDGLPGWKPYTIENHYNMILSATPACKIANESPAQVYAKKFSLGHLD